jgi:hypothetical protein
MWEEVLVEEAEAEEEEEEEEDGVAGCLFAAFATNAPPLRTFSLRKTSSEGLNPILRRFRRRVCAIWIPTGMRL